eukprot:4567778-Amphidinium_carterae.2
MSCTGLIQEVAMCLQEVVLLQPLVQPGVASSVGHTLDVSVQAESDIFAACTVVLDISALVTVSISWGSVANAMDGSATPAESLAIVPVPEEDEIGGSSKNSNQAHHPIQQLICLSILLYGMETCGGGGLSTNVGDSWLGSTCLLPLRSKHRSHAR